jgi:hypothetical protein
MIFMKGSVDQKADILSRFPAYSFKQQGTTTITEIPVTVHEESLETRPMELYDKTLEYIDIAVMDIAL